MIRVEGPDAKIVSGVDFEVTSPREAGDTFSVIIPFRFEAPPNEGMFWLRFAYDRDDQILTILRGQRFVRANNAEYQSIADVAKRLGLF